MKTETDVSGIKMMKNLTLRNITDACAGILHLPKEAPFLADRTVSSITTDSRKAEEGCLFAAICGEHFDGHAFIGQVFEKGALCVISEKDLEEERHPWIRVSSTLQALTCIAQYYLQVLDIPVVGIAGSVGKTSTKEMIASVLSQKYCTLATAGNFNNELGLPLTIFRLREEHEMAVLEMGISDFGEMHRLAAIARPDTCVITNIGECHLEFLKDRDGVLRAKTEIFDFLKEDGHIILNGNDDKLITVRMVKGIQPVFFGLPGEGTQNPAQGSSRDPADDRVPELSVWADEITPRGLDGISCRIHTQAGDFQALIPIPGRHMVMNALAGTAVGLTYGLSLFQIRAGIENLRSVSGRLHMVKTESYTIIDDCYNANPMSMAAALGVLKDASTRKAAILGDMFELGEEEEKWHREVGRKAAGCGLDLLIGIGPRSRVMTEEAAEQDPALAIRYFPTLEDFMQALKTEPFFQKGDTILVKASHGMNFTSIVEALQQEP